MLIFDFDGVMINSMDEVIVTAFNAVTDQLFTSINDIPEGAINLFKHNRFHVQAIGDAIPLMEWCCQNRRNKINGPLKKSAYNHIVQNTSVPLKIRTKHFFHTRKQFILADKKVWLSLNSPFQPLWDRLCRYRNSNLIILTNKNRSAVIEICLNFNLKIEPENIYSGDDGITKNENLRQIHKRFRKSSYRFVDDSVKNLRSIDLHFNGSRKFIELFLASWGYTGPDDEKRAALHGYTCISQKGLITMFDKTS